jgi:D-alanyl-lipoteichoic acid acyltransferase DltB (MBOAT superfamily)
MLFNSFAFIIFAPVFFLCYFLTQGKTRLLLCLVASYFFYSWWDYRFLSLIFLITVINYVAGKQIDNFKEKRYRKSILTLAVVFNLGVLCIFKYFGFFTESFAAVLNQLGMSITVSTINIVLPVGISFYTFQALSYVLDIYRKEIAHEPSLLKFATFVALFPQLVAGPIVRAKILIPQLSCDQPFSMQRIYDGFMMVLYGFFIKVTVADSIAPVVDRMLLNPINETSLVLLIGSVLFSFQIYCDFHGYSLIAIGLGKMMGFDFGINFNSPYLSTNFSEFWKRWHISLSSWLRDYLYIPLGGNRYSSITTCKNLMTTMFLGGLWHGANWTFVIWGLLHGMYLIIQHSFQRINFPFTIKANKWNQFLTDFLSISIVFSFTTFAWIFFRSPNIQHSISIITKIFAFDSFNISSIPNIFLVVKCIMLISILMSIELLNHFKIKFITNRYVKLLSIPVALWGISLFGTFAGNAFIYFQF